MLISVKIRLKFFFGIWVIIFAQFLQYIPCTVFVLTILSRHRPTIRWIPAEDPFEETEGSIEISYKGHVTILSILDNDSEEQEDLFYYCKTDF